MRIIADDRDYYDTAGWADQEHIFVREPVEGEWRIPLSIPGPVNPFLRPQNDGIMLDFGVCCLAGEIFPWTRKTEWQGGKKITALTYEPDVSAAWVREAKAPWAFRDQDPGAFMNTPRNALEKWLLDNRAITAILEAQFRGWGERREPGTRVKGAINCAGLDEMELYKVIDPATAHMRIDGYISGVLGNNPQVGEISDVSKAGKAGFDEWSFKTRPGTKKPRGQNREHEQRDMEP